MVLIKLKGARVQQGVVDQAAPVLLNGNRVKRNFIKIRNYVDGMFVLGYLGDNEFTFFIKGFLKAFCIDKELSL